jgi:hypothetical protein
MARVGRYITLCRAPADKKTTRTTPMGKGDKQHGNREAKKPKADKKLAPLPASFLKPEAQVRKPGAKPPAK